MAHCEKHGDSLLLATDAEREEVFFEETIEGDRAFNTLLSAIMPKLK